MKRLVLASQSPRRREILAAAGFGFEVRVANVEEVRDPHEPPDAYVERLSRQKAQAVACAEDEVVLGADTVVVCEGEVLEKPRDAKDAARMLRMLAGREHRVLTGVFLRTAAAGAGAVESTRVRFAAMTEEEIGSYVASGEPMDKAGAYAIQGLASRFITGIEGCYFNVVGLPLRRVYELLGQVGAI